MGYPQLAASDEYGTVNIMIDPKISEYFRKLVAKRNKKYGKAWRHENAKKAAAARKSASSPVQQS